jgi:long-chain fatty acid transport protein
MRKTTVVIGGLAALALVRPGEVGATGFELRETSAVGQGVSFAGSAARNDDPSMMFVNPAALAGLPGIQGAVVVSGILPTSSAENVSGTRNAAFGGSAITGSAGGDIAHDALVPATYVSARIAPDWTLGLGVTAPFGLTTKSPNDAIARYHALTSSLRTVNVTPAVAWQARPDLALGAGLQLQQAHARLSSAVDFGTIGAASGLPFAPGSRDGRSTVVGDDTAVGWQLGAQWEPVQGTRLGLAFRSALFHELTGDATFEGVPAPLNASPNFRNTGARAKLVTPETFHVGLSQRFGENWTLLGGLEWTNWSRFRELRINFDNGRAPSVTEENWRDSYFLSLGGEYRLTPAVTLRAGVAYDQSPIPAADRTPRVPDNDRYWLSFGASWQAMPGVTLTAGYTHIFVNEGQVRLRDPGPNNTNLFRGNLDANYRGSVDIFAIQARFAF